MDSLSNDLPNIPTDDELLLETSRLYLEPIVERHHEAMHSLFGDPRLHKYTSFELLTLEKQKEKCAQWATKKSPDLKEIWINWAAREKASGKVIAHFQAGMGNRSLATAGYLVTFELQGKGFGTEGMGKVFEFLDKKMLMTEVRVFTDVGNQASHSLARKLGMKQIDVIKDANLLNGIPSDDLVFSRTFK